eukprot:1316776-Rhodomonas_salina.1
MSGTERAYATTSGAGNVNGRRRKLRMRRYSPSAMSSTLRSRWMSLPARYRKLLPYATQCPALSYRMLLRLYGMS